MPQELNLPSFAKINLGLSILGTRPDGFHDLFTVFQTVSLADDLRFAEAETISLTCSDLSIPAGRSNLIIQAAQAMQYRSGTRCGVAIEIIKRIPSPGGLGGGSSNAAVTLLALNKLWRTRASMSDLHALAAELGSDVPFFLYGGTAIGTGRGTDIETVRDIRGEYGLIVVPNVDVSTADAFAGLAARNLTTDEAERILFNCRLRARGGFTLRELPGNDFEESIFLRFPEIGIAKAVLLELGAVSAGMSGSGASVFGFFDKSETRQTAIKALGERTNWRSFAVAAISRQEYREALEQVF